MMEIFLGFISGLIVDFLRGLMRDHAARSSAKRLGRLQERNASLHESLKAKQAAQKIREGVANENDFKNLVDDL